ncbi:MAG: zf-HC2 domain-containing protein [Anaerolineaceae bacterium]
MHVTDSSLRAYLDQQLSDQERSRIESHLQDCPDCRHRLAELTSLASQVNLHLAALKPAPDEAPRSASIALRQFNLKETRPMFKIFSKRNLRPLWVILAVIAVLAVSLTFQPVQALASSFLGLFRVQQVVILPINSNTIQNLQNNQDISKAVSQLFSDSVDVTRPATPPQQVPDVATASKLAGFEVRQWKDSTVPAVITVSSGQAFTFTVNRDRAQQILTALGNKDLQLPKSIDGAKIAVDIPSGVSIAYGDCPTRRSKSAEAAAPTDQPTPTPDCLVLLQNPSPTVNAPSSIDPAQLAAIGLQALGMSADQAKSFSQKVDWSTTLVIPIPTGEVTYQDVQVDGASGYVLAPASGSSSANARYSVVWVKGGVIYSVAGTGDPAQGLAVANDLQ